MHMVQGMRCVSVGQSSWGLGGGGGGGGGGAGWNGGVLARRRDLFGEWCFSGVLEGAGVGRDLSFGDGAGGFGEVEGCTTGCAITGVTLRRTRATGFLRRLRM